MEIISLHFQVVKSSQSPKIGCTFPPSLKRKDKYYFRFLFGFLRFLKTSWNFVKARLPLFFAYMREAHQQYFFYRLFHWDSFGCFSAFFVSCPVSWQVFPVLETHSNTSLALQKEPWNKILYRKTLMGDKRNLDFQTGRSIHKFREIPCYYHCRCLFNQT